MVPHCSAADQPLGNVCSAVLPYLITSSTVQLHTVCMLPIPLCLGSIALYQLYNMAYPALPHLFAFQS